MKKILFFSLLLALTISASAQGPRDRYERKRIANGYHNRELTRGETHSLVRGQRNIRHAERKARRDGHISPFERHRIHQMKKHQSRKTYHYKHNRHRRVH